MSDPYRRQFDYGRSSLLRPFYQNPNKTPLLQLIMGFGFGVLLAPWGAGLYFLIIFTIVFELLYYLFTAGDPRYWQLELRVGAFLASILGWIVGRTFSGLPIAVYDPPEMVEAGIFNVDFSWL